MLSRKDSRCFPSLIVYSTFLHLSTSHQILRVQRCTQLPLCEEHAPLLAVLSKVEREMLKCRMRRCCLEKTFKLWSTPSFLSTTVQRDRKTGQGLVQTFWLHTWGRAVGSQSRLHLYIHNTLSTLGSDYNVEVSAECSQLWKKKAPKIPPHALIIIKVMPSE